MATDIVDYETIDSVLAVIDGPRPKNSGSSSEREGRGMSWDLECGWDGAYKAYTGGWAEGAARAYELADTLAPKPRASRTTLERSVVGMFPNVAAHLAGAPNSMYRVTQKNAQGRPYVHLYTPIGFSAMVDANGAFNKGCAMVALIDALENAGCRVKVTALVCSMHSGTRVTYRFMLKDYSDRLDIDQLIFTVAHPAFFRRIVFGLYERSADKYVRDSTRMGYGKTVDIVEADCPVDNREVLVILPRMTWDDNSKDSATFLQEMVEMLPEDIRTEIEG